MKISTERPSCYGDLDTVFPMAQDGLRASPDACLACPHKTECLRNALKGARGMTVRDEKIDRAYASGTMGFFERWSRKKAIHRRMKQSTSNKGEDRENHSIDRS
ncbi:MULTISPECIES: hypothetical protein [Desulfococcus]|jgi:hypothetical protein|uniref:4Fe-4S Wbl-type domain-containing protein n=1 Tax=Desulfococcus multivorans DSM 2059 TaxID=1121405 RepID=S7TGD9_DESML|nr:hypothetical protein [Desulfococcus multivorans]AOY59820.1 conserved uncharacterized protein [Desulfococcus multivorans]AQV01986.1 hypothetical protein B2D07_15280 [Desulfococcus multivorans]EPR35821.1 hypothetical protein dsmv_0526 [Desulfococcus multivorans DSM 2059]MDX9819019.1 hypothetical protein [Desulfococcus multivorans]SJZ33718.1 hypothetical protein SAMN02745446_00043 [Desulfococcus multivorans DSM 2059]